MTQAQSQWVSLTPNLLLEIFAVQIRAGTKAIVFGLGLPLMQPTELSLMLKAARLAAGNPMPLNLTLGKYQMENGRYCA